MARFHKQSCCQVQHCQWKTRAALQQFACMNNNGEESATMFYATYISCLNFQTLFEVTYDDPT
ncbi:hypothetical protein ES332_A12G252800v1 [Gossypium tomentosum]|uniref:Uncharacterized protein n=1 Tax=Gossypium tomentosum TaxID=34277 RepID=A0A5D2N2I4_GOSTO|nr:hypothetical protein ES332_A12G252800v1 [Gossypium tomentosum]